MQLLKPCLVMTCSLRIMIVKMFQIVLSGADKPRGAHHAGKEKDRQKHDYDKK